MKNFIISFLIFILPFLLLAYGLDIFISKNLRDVNSFAKGENSTWNDIFNGNIKSDIVIYGSSRAWVQINPTMISDSIKKPTYNLGIDGHNFWLQYLRHQLFLKYNHKPELIIQTLDVFTLEKYKNLYNSEQFLPYMLFNKQIEEATISYNGYTDLDFKIPLIRYYGKSSAIIQAFKSYIYPSDKKITRIKGYRGIDSKWTGELEKVKGKIPYYVAKFDTPSIHLFESYLLECKQNKINIVLVYTPEYIEGQHFVKNRAEIFSIYKNLSVKYNIPFLDYSGDSISYKKKYFYHASHLNKTGSTLFTNKLIKDLKMKNIL